MIKLKKMKKIIINLFKPLNQWEPCESCGKWCWGKCTENTDFPD